MVSPNHYPLPSAIFFFFLKLILLKPVKLKLLLSRAAQVPFIMASYLGRQSAWKGSLAIMHIQSPSLPYHWLIHQTFIFCPLSTVSLCLSLSILGCYERWKHMGGGREFFLPQLSPPRFLLIRFHTWDLKLSPDSALWPSYFWPWEGWDGLSHSRWTFYRMVAWSRQR